MSIYSNHTDSELLILLSQGNVQAFEMLYTRHWAAMFKTSFLILRSDAASKDVVQDIFIWLWEHRHKIKVQSLKSYLNAAVKFKVANYIRSGKIRTGFFEELSDYKTSNLAASSEEILEVKELKNIINLAIVYLPEKCQEIFQLSRGEHLSNNEIAQKLGISVKTVENQITIAIRRIRIAAEPYIISVLITALFLGF